MCSILKINSNLVDKINVQFKNENKDIEFKNIDNREWAIPVRIEIIKKSTVEFANQLYLQSVEFNLLTHIQQQNSV